MRINSFMKNTETKKEKTIQVISGTVVSSKNHCTIVSVERIVKHPKYGKYLKHRKKLKAHDEADSREIGSVVQIVPCAPVSKEKRFRVLTERSVV